MNQMIEINETKSVYLTYVHRLTELCKTEPGDELKKVLKERLEGLGPTLLRDEGDRIDVLIHVYSILQKEKNEKALYRLRRMTIDLLLETLNEHEKSLHDESTLPETKTILEQIDFLGHLVAWFEFKKAPNLSIDLTDKLYGFLNRQEVALTEFMELKGIALKTAVRAFDLWLAAASWENARKWPHHIQDMVENLFINNIEKLKPLKLHFDNDDDEMFMRLLFLSFKAVLRANPLWVAKKGLCMMTDCLDYLSNNSDKVMGKWWGVCREINLLFRQKTEWQEEFCKGINSIIDKYSEWICCHKLSDTMIESLRFMGIEKEVLDKLISLKKSKVFPNRLPKNLPNSVSIAVPHKEREEHLKVIVVFLPVIFRHS